MNKDIQRKLAKLAALESGGVDNWDGYDIALEDWRKENEHEANCEDFLDAIMEEIAANCRVEQPAGVGCGYAVLDEKGALLELIMNTVEKFKEKP